MRLRNHALLSTAASWVLALIALPAAAQTINEVRIDHSGADVDEYFELMGTPGAPLDSLYYIVIGDGGTSVCGNLESVTPLTGYSIQADGLFAACKSATPTLAGYDAVGVTSMNFENSDNVTHMIVMGFPGATNRDLDLNDDGTIDNAIWGAIVDCVALIEFASPACGVPAAGDESIYCGTTVGPDGSFVPGHAYICPDAGIWAVGPFDIAMGRDTPGNPNPTCFEITDETRTPCAPLTGEAATVTADVTSAATAVTSVSLTYTLNGGGPTTVAMTGPVGSTWTGTIPAQPNNGTLVEYQVRAINAAPDTVFGFNQGYIVGTSTIASLRVNDANERNIYRFYGVNIGGNVTATFNTYSAVNTDGYIQDATGGINVFQFGVHSVAPALGDEVRISGALDQFNGKLEISPVSACDTMTIEVDGPGAVPSPLMVNTNILNDIDAFERGNSPPLEGLLIRMQYPEVDATAPSTIPAGVNTTYRITNSYPDTSLMFIDVDTNIDGTTLETNMVDVTGIGTQFDSSSPFTGSHQIAPRSTADIIYVGTSGTTETARQKPRLFQNTPNPFSQRTFLRFEISRTLKSDNAVPVQIRLYDVAGRKIASIVDGEMEPGTYAIPIDAVELGLGSGLYFYELVVDGRSAGKEKLIVSR